MTRPHKVRLMLHRLELMASESPLVVDIQLRQQIRKANARNIFTVVPDSGRFQLSNLLGYVVKDQL